MRRLLFALFPLLVVVACGDDLEININVGDGERGDGDVVTESRIVASFDALHAENGVAVELNVDPAADGTEVELTVRSDSNLLEYVVTEVDGDVLTASIDGPVGGIHSTEGLEVAATIARLGLIRADNGAVVGVNGLSGSPGLRADNGAVVDLDGAGLALDAHANNGAVVDAGGFDAETVELDVDNGAVVSVCASISASGTVRNGAVVTIRCGGDTSGVEASGGAVVG